MYFRPEMIQRIQSLWLIIAAVLSGVLLFYPVSHFYDGIDFPEQLDIENWKNFLYVGMFILNVLALLFSLLAFFFFKNRKRQLKLIRWSQLFLLLFIIDLIVGFFWFQTDYFSAGMSTDALLEAVRGYLLEYRGLIIPLFIMLYNRLAFNGVHADEALIRSRDRLR